MVSTGAAQVPSFTITTIAGSASKTGYAGDGGPAVNALLNDPRGIATDPAGNVYFCDRLNHVVRKIDTNGVIRTVAGTGTAGYNGDNIPGTKAELNTPWRVTLDAAGNLYIADSVNDRIRRLATDGTITTVAGNGQAGYSGDNGTATGATLRIPEQAEIDALGNLYIADTGNNVIRKVDTHGTITTVAGNGFGACNGNCTGNGAYAGDGGPAVKAELNLPVSIAVDAAGNLFISDQSNNVIRKVSASGVITTVAGRAGSAGFGYSGDGGPATNATFQYPAGIALDTAGDLYITDFGNNVLRVMMAGGTMWTAAGNGRAGWTGDGGAAAGAELNSPRQVAVGTFGEVYIADSFNNAIRKLTPGAPTVGHVTNAFGNIAVVAANTWITIKGENLAPAGDSRIWQTSDFVNGRMPTSLDGVSVAVTAAGGYQANAYVYYISPTQINILAPPDLPGGGVVTVQVNNNGVKSAPGQVLVQPLSPTFFVFGAGPYVTAVHLNGSLIGPTTLYPGASTPAATGETIVLFANGFGPTSVPVTAGAAQQSGTLPALPAITVGGLPATVQFAGLIGPGLYQFNVVLPAGAANGDNLLALTYNGYSAQSGTVLTVGR
jgi:uncharacterized protein (TIGR03437 family)